MKKILILIIIVAQSICVMAAMAVENSKINPCKSECLYESGKTAIEYVAVVPGLVAVTEVMTEGAGNIIYQESYMQ